MLNVQKAGILQAAGEELPKKKILLGRILFKRNRTY